MFLVKKEAIILLHLLRLRARHDVGHGLCAKVTNTLLLTALVCLVFDVYTDQITPLIWQQCAIFLKSFWRTL